MTDPAEKIYNFETAHLFLSFCTFCCLLEPKKLNLANIFLMILRKQKFRELMKQYCDFKSDYAALKYFLKYDPTLYKSKYIMKYINSKEFIQI